MRFLRKNKKFWTEGKKPLNRRIARYFEKNKQNKMR